ncbi:hypothetical protein BV22DRAFT_1052748 [Leucogyrophana mollusca]|uniref:Uncharacterized protein n=1 Tax=Leucogyrophana mollusca TaxID=85980 RepID=A0ACB8AV24_9AGAM|nr:hypothetical protein BV22DRAFT_1052748 [Leucogyrophana mollusca]
MDADDWDTHLSQHFDEIYKPHARGHDSSVNPLYEGYMATVKTGVIYKPAICPFCLWDEGLSIAVRMHQHCSSTDLISHIMHAHHHPLLANEDNHNYKFTCPSQACTARGTFDDLVALYNHLIANHKLPFAGIRGKSSDGALPLLDTLDNLAVKPLDRESKRSAKRRPGSTTLAPPSPSSSRPLKKTKNTVPSSQSTGNATSSIVLKENAPRS